jgi:hypothetical protein
VVTSVVAADLAVVARALLINHLVFDLKQTYVILNLNRKF